MNDKIARARQAAMDVLKPNRAELEHGLELHKQSVVVDAYGFAPLALHGSNSVISGRMAS